MIKYLDDVFARPRVSVQRENANTKFAIEPTAPRWHRKQPLNRQHKIKHLEDAVELRRQFLLAFLRGCSAPGRLTRPHANGVSEQLTDMDDLQHNVELTTTKHGCVSLGVRNRFNEKRGCRVSTHLIGDVRSITATTYGCAQRENYKRFIQADQCDRTTNDCPLSSSIASERNARTTSPSYACKHRSPRLSVSSSKSSG